MYYAENPPPADPNKNPLTMKEHERILKARAKDALKKLALKKLKDALKKRFEKNNMDWC